MCIMCVYVAYVTVHIFEEVQQNEEEAGEEYD